MFVIKKSHQFVPLAIWVLNHLLRTKLRDGDTREGEKREREREREREMSLLLWKNIVMGDGEKREREMSLLLITYI